MRIADPDRGFRKFREDIQRKREAQNQPLNRPEQQNVPTNSSYSNSVSSSPATETNTLQSQINNMQAQVNNLQRSQVQPQPQPQQAPVYTPAPSPPSAPQYTPVQQTVTQPKEKISLTGLGFITLFLTAVMAYMYKVDTFVQSNIDKLLVDMPVPHNLLFAGVAVLGVVLIIAGLTSGRK